MTKAPDGSPSVCQVVSTFHPVIGGVQSVVFDLAVGLRQEGIDVVVLTRRLPGLPRSELVGGIRILRLGLPLYGKLGATTFAIHSFLSLGLRYKRYGLLHAHNIDAPLLLCIAARILLRRRIIVTIHGEKKLERKAETALGRLRLRALRRHIQVHIALTDAVDRALRRVGIPETKITRIGNAVSLNYFKPLDTDAKARLRNSMGLREGDTVFVFVGRLVALKQVDTLVRAWAQAALGDAILLIVGAGPQEGSLKRLAAEVGSETIRFCGATDRVSDYLRAADVFVLPSKEEGLSRALVEAMAAGLPAIASDLPGHEGIVVDGETGMSVTPGDEDQLAEAIRYLAADRAFRVALGRGARNLATREFSLSTSVARHIAAYRRVTAAEGEPTAGV